MADDHERARAEVAVLVSGRPAPLAAGLLAGLDSLGWSVGLPRSGAASAVIIALAAPGRSGETGPGRAAEAWPDVEPWRQLTIVVGPRAAAAGMIAALAAGAAAAVDAEQPFLDLLAELDGLLAGRQRRTRRGWMASLAGHATARAALDRLTPREQAVLASLVRGRTATEIAEASGVALTTVRSQIHQVLLKLEVTSQLAAVALTHEHAESGLLREAVRALHQF